MQQTARHAAVPIGRRGDLQAAVAIGWQRTQLGRVPGADDQQQAALLPVKHRAATGQLGERDERL